MAQCIMDLPHRLTVQVLKSANLLELVQLCTTSKVLNNFIESIRQRIVAVTNEVELSFDRDCSELVMFVKVEGNQQRMRFRQADFLGFQAFTCNSICVNFSMQDLHDTPVEQLIPSQYFYCQKLCFTSVQHVPDFLIARIRGYQQVHFYGVCPIPLQILPESVEKVQLNGRLNSDEDVLETFKRFKEVIAEGAITTALEFYRSISSIIERGSGNLEHLRLWNFERHERLFKNTLSAVKLLDIFSQPKARHNSSFTIHLLDMPNDRIFFILTYTEWIDIKIIRTSDLLETLFEFLGDSSTTRLFPYWRLPSLSRLRQRLEASSREEWGVIISSFVECATTMYLTDIIAYMCPEEMKLHYRHPPLLKFNT